MILIPGPFIEVMLLGPVEDGRPLQDSPIVADLWVEFGKYPGAALDLLIAPYPGQHTGTVASLIDSGLEPDRDAEIAFLSSLVVARLTFEEVVQLVVPKTAWWIQRWDQAVTPTRKRGQKTQKKLGETHELQNYPHARLELVIERFLDEARRWHLRISSRSEGMQALDRFLALTGLFLWAADHVPEHTPNFVSAIDVISYILDMAKPSEIAPLLRELGGRMLKDPARQPLVSQVSLNRIPMPALTRSIQAVKADAAHTLFRVNCSRIVWGVLDSGIDGAHPAFGGRVKRTFDFKNFRKIVSLSNARASVRAKNLAELKSNPMWVALKSPPEDPDSDLKILADNARTRGPIHWELVEKFIELTPDTPPLTSHGTHVAGVIGASREAARKAAGGRDDIDFADGMCPDIQLYDFRVLGGDIKDAEFAIIAALHFIRDLNERNNFITIQGVNLSLSIPHDVRNFACGRTPICNECERLIESGVVVVAAAGNNGYKSFETSEGSYSSYTAFSITDPGNADGVITVGATHGFSPHTYGVSFFSSRGPTGDGRRKPDLVAPGERIRAPILGGEWGDLDGTSIAAPHVSGAAAMLMARYSELIGQPRRIKRMLCETATDLGRDRTFQGNGMLDVLRAFQSF